MADGVRMLDIAPRTASALPLRTGEQLRVIDLEGEQVADLVCCVPGAALEWLSNGRTFDSVGTLALTVGHRLYSDRNRALMTIVDDPVGRHDFLISACSVEMFRDQYGIDGAPANCRDNLLSALAQAGVTASELPTPLNVFMHTRVAGDGRIRIHPPLSKAGDALTLRAELDLVVAVSACSAPMCNNHSFGPIGLEVLAPD